MTRNRGGMAHFCQ